MPRARLAPAVSAVSAVSFVLAALVLAPPGLTLTPDQVDTGASRAARGLKRVVKQLASDRLAGRDNGSPGSARAQAILRKRLARIGEGPGPAPDPYAQPFEREGEPGTNLLAVIPGGDLPDEFVLVGAHYDHFADGLCLPEAGDPGDTTCNGAMDNASGTAVVLAVGKAIAKLRDAPRRSVALALWDAEEDGLLGSAHYVADPLLPLVQTVAYVNLDVLGTVQLPSLRANTLVLASETGGDVLRAAAEAAVDAQALTASFLSYAFGQSRSDYASFGEAGVPTVFFSDGLYPCYHTAGDEVRRIDFRKLAEQSAIAFRTVVALADGEAAPAFTPPTGGAAYEDAVALHEILARSVPADLGLFPPDVQAEIAEIADAVEATVADGAAAFDVADSAATLAAAATLSARIPALECPAF